MGINTHFRKYLQIRTLIGTKKESAAHTQIASTTCIGPVSLADVKLKKMCLPRFKKKPIHILVSLHCVCALVYRTQCHVKSRKVEQ